MKINAKFYELDDKSLIYLENDPEVRLRYLDFLTTLEDLLSTSFPGIEPAMEDSDALEEKLISRVDKLPTDAEIRSVAAYNFNTVLTIIRESLDNSAANEFRKALLLEYNVVRLMRSRGGTPNITRS